MKHFILIVLVGCSTLLCAQNKKTYKETEYGFTDAGNKISGKLITPLTTKGKKLPVIVFIHGSGPEDYSSSGNYNYLFDQFTKNGFACYSWDTPGTGNSKGQWYTRGIKERVNEVNSAIKMLRKITVVDPSKIGLWGISQAGWIIPDVASVSNPAFIINVSSPVTTIIEEEMYRVKAGMGAEGFSQKDINEAIQYTKDLKALVDGDKPYEEFAALQEKTKDAPWVDYVGRGDETIYQYISVLLKDDRAPDLSKLKCPVLAIWGANDLVVPPTESAAAFSKKMKEIGNTNAVVKILPDADHTMTLNLTGKGSETSNRRTLYKDSPKDIFAPGYISSMISWLNSMK